MDEIIWHKCNCGYGDVLCGHLKTMKKKILLILLIAIAIKSNSQVIRYETDTIEYYTEGKTDKNGLKQGYWKYYYTQKVNKIIDLKLINEIDTFKLSKSGCYAEGKYLDNKKIGQWIYHIGVCRQIEGTYAKKTKKETYNPDGSVKTEYSELFYHWHYIINKDSTKIIGGVRLYNDKYIGNILIKGEKQDNGKIICRFETRNGQLIDEFEFGILDAKCEIIYSGYYDRKIKQNARKHRIIPNGE